MRIGIVSLIIFTTSIQLFSATPAKSQAIDKVEIILELKNESLLSAFQKIEAQTPFHFMYRNGDVKNIRNLRVPAGRQSVEAFLKTILANTSLKYRQVDKQILITPAGETPVVADQLLTGVSAEITQAVVVQGKVTDDKGLPLPGVSIKLKNSATGTVSDINGNYSISLTDATGTLVFSYIGFKTKEVDINGQLRINVTISEDMNTLNEVVVVGYGSQKRSDITGSVTSVPKDRLQNLPVTNVLQAIEGSVAGLNITTNSTAPGSTVDVLVRGQNSIRASSGPFIVVDGIPITSQGGLTNDINPNDIASIEILKDASAVAIYGTRGSNGVILITTKRGTTGKPRISYNTYAGPEFKTNLLELMSGDQYVEKNLEYARQTRGTVAPVPNSSELTNYNAGITTDWINEISQQGHIQDHNLNISGGTEDIKYYISGEFLDQKGVLKGYQYKRASLRSNLDANLTKWLTAGASLLYSSNNYDGGKVNFLQAGKISPYGQNLDAKGNYIFFPMAPDTFYEHPSLGLNNEVFNHAKNMTGNFYGELKPAFAKGLKFRFNGSYSFIPKRTNFYAGRNSNNPVGSARANNGETNSWIIENILTYDRSWGKHRIDLTGLYSAQKSTAFNSGVSANTFINDQLGYNSIEAAAVQTASSGLIEEQYLSQMGRLNYSFAGKYLFTATARRDGYSAFGANTSKYATFPSVALAWNISQENFIKNIAAINNLKLRVSYGTTGNQAIPAYRTITQLGSIQYIYNAITTSGVTATVLGNPNLKWESTTGTNLGLDFSILKDRISGTIDAYKTSTNDVIIERQIPVISGYGSILDNVAETSNKGIEVSLNTLNIKKENFSWRSGFNFAANRNEVSSIYGDGKDDIVNRLFLGKSLGAIYDYKLLGVWQTGEDPSKSDPGAKPGDLKFEDINGDGKITTDGDRMYLGNSLPKFSGGITNTVYYKQFSLNVFLQGVFGVLKNNPVLDIEAFAGRQNLFADIGYWTPTNGNNSRPSLAFSNSRRYGYPSKSDYVRLKDITMSYRFKEPIANRAGLGSAMVYISGRNIQTFSDWFGYDPEYTSFAKESTLNYPNVASYVLGINVSLK
ncbi:MAG TPA: TonB-dependent receptor [Sphingobacteriaceae bacterium]|nr:TonB-dependent receptor [Sphingobacteriaceae bacterium]